MTRQEAFDLSGRCTTRFEKTRDLQWKMNITAWSLIVLGIYYFGKNELQVSKCFLWILSSVFLALHSMYIYNIQKALKGSRNVEVFIYTAFK